MDRITEKGAFTPPHGVRIPAHDLPADCKDERARDPLSEVLAAVRLDGAHFFFVDGEGPWEIQPNPARELVPRVLPQSDHLVSYHTVIRGPCWAGLEGEPLFELGEGDVIFFPQGDTHVFVGGQVDATRRVIVQRAPAPFPARHSFGEGGERTRVLCGFLGCAASPFNPLLGSLPRVLLSRGGGNRWASLVPVQLAAESQEGLPGAQGLLTRVAELVFIEAIRGHLDSLPPEERGWLAGLRDDVVGPALTALHADPTRDWTLPTLARCIGTSRSRLVQRFTSVVGRPPMQYLAAWRMQLAAQRLTSTTDKVAAIAFDVGYDSEAAFSRAFKRATGVSPRSWRQRRAA